MHWLRWWDEAENLLLWGTEQAELERQRAEEAIAQLQALQAKMRELGINPN